MIISSRNTIASESWVPKTYLSAQGTLGSVVFSWQNPTGFGSSWALQIGETGQETTEIAILSNSSSGTLGTLDTSLAYSHPVDTPIYGIKYNQVVFEVSTAGITGTATPHTDGTVTYQADRDLTFFDDANGSASYGYRTYFRNSTLNITSTESDWITSAGFDFYSLAKMRERVKDKIWDPSIVSDSQINDWINEWKDEMQNAVISVNGDYALGTVDVGFGTNGYGTVTTADFKQPRRIWITYDGSDWYHSTKMPINYPVPGQDFSSAHPYHYWFGDNIIGVEPPENGGTARIHFYRMGTPMLNDTDTLPFPMRPYTKSFVDYSVAQAQYKDSKIQEYRDKLAEANMAKDQFTKQLTPRDKSGPQFITIVEATGGDTQFWG